MSFISGLGKYRDRILTGAALISAVVIISIINNQYLMWLVIGVMYMTAFYEANQLFGVENNSLYVYALLMWVAVLFYPYPDDLLFIGGLVFASISAYSNKGEWKHFLPFMYPTAGFLFLFTLYKDYHIAALIWLTVIVVATDIGAFVVGKSIGKHQFSPTSPNKTIEGVVGGVVIATVLGFFVGVTIVDIEKSVLISLIVAVASVFGDLFESLLKRRAGVKDSGNILPGHGGILDRIDGFLFASIALVVLLRALT